MCTNTCLRIHVSWCYCILFDASVYIHCTVFHMNDIKAKTVNKWIFMTRHVRLCSFWLKWEYFRTNLAFLTDRTSHVETQTETKCNVKTEVQCRNLARYFRITIFTSGLGKEILVNKPADFYTIFHFNQTNRQKKEETNY